MREKLVGKHREKNVSLPHFGNIKNLFFDVNEFHTTK